MTQNNRVVTTEEQKIISTVVGKYNYKYDNDNIILVNKLSVEYL